MLTLADIISKPPTRPAATEGAGMSGEPSFTALGDDELFRSGEASRQ